MFLSVLGDLRKHFSFRNPGIKKLVLCFCKCLGYIWRWALYSSKLVQGCEEPEQTRSGDDGESPIRQPKLHCLNG